MPHEVRAGEGVVYLRLHNEGSWIVTISMIPEDAGRLAGELLKAARAADDAA